MAREKTGDDDDGKRFRPLPRTDVIVRAGAPIDLSDFRRQLVDGALLREATEVRQGPAPIGFFDPGEYGVQAS